MPRKKIPVEQVRIGMFIDSLDSRWIDSPFWKSAFILSDHKDLQALKSSAVKNVWIDTAKGLDVDQQEPEQQFPEKPIPVSKAIPATPQSRVSLEQEMEQARKIQTEATEKITSMFQDVRMGKAIQAEDALPVTNEIYLSVIRNPGALISLTRLKTADNYTYMHSVAVCALMIALGRQLNLDDSLVKSLGMAGLLHDVGKMVIPDEILNKPGSLTDSEFDLIKSHPGKGWALLKDSEDVDEITLDVCLHHHEKVDGSGYPEKLAGDNISLYAKMGAVCDVYDAITSDRSYKKGWAPADSIRKMASWKQGHFDEVVFDSFVRMIGIYPIGTLVKLNTGRLAVVIDQSKSLLQPIVKTVYSTTARGYIEPKIVDLQKTGGKIDGIENPGDYGIDINKITGLVE